MEKDGEAKLLAEVDHLFTGDLLTKPVAEFSEDDAISAYAILHATEAWAKARKGALREKLLDLAKEQGSATEKGGYRYDGANGSTVTREKRMPSAPGSDAVKKLLSSKGIALSEVFTSKSVTVLNPSKLNRLVELGKIPESDITKIRDAGSSLAVRVKVPSVAAAMATYNASALADDDDNDDAPVEKKPRSTGARKK